MCGRFANTEYLNIIAEHYDIDEIYSTSEPSYNITPGNRVPAIVSGNNNRILKDFRWGLVPHWAKDPKIGYKMINARAETVAEKPSFKKAFSTRRCLVVASGFFEWEKMDDEKHPVYVYLHNSKFMIMAGLHEKWVSGEDKILETCTIITTTPNSLLEPIHNRMPVILHEQDIDIWLDAKNHPAEEVTPLLKPFPSDEMAYHHVSKLVNSPRNNSPECIASID
jgi:putative SOS response-associated peptidase YedK